MHVIVTIHMIHPLHSFLDPDGWRPRCTAQSYIPKDTNTSKLNLELTYRSLYIPKELHFHAFPTVAFKKDPNSVKASTTQRRSLGIGFSTTISGSTETPGTPIAAVLSVHSASLLFVRGARPAPRLRRLHCCLTQNPKPALKPAANIDPTLVTACPSREANHV